MNKSTGLKGHTVLVYDTNGLKNFWEEIIEANTKQKEVEDLRQTKSALNKWVFVKVILPVDHSAKEC